MPLNFNNGISIDALVDSNAYVSAVAQNKFDGMKQQALGSIIETNDPPIFQSQVANGCSEKPIATVTLEFDIGDLTFAETLCRDEVFTVPIIGFHFMKYNSLVIDTIHGLFPFLHLTMQVKSTASDTSAKPQPILIHDALTLPSMTAKTTTTFVDHPSVWNTTGTVTPVEKITETASLLISHSISKKLTGK